MSIKNKIFLLVLLFCFASLCAPASELKIAVVNTDKAFRSYYRTLQMEKQLQQQAQVYRDYITKESNKLRDLQQKFQVERDKSQNLAINDTDRKKSAQNAENIAKEFQSMENQLAAYVKDKDRQMAELQTKSRKDIYDQISLTVTNLAKERKFDLVLDSSGVIPLVVYSIPSLDLTEEIINYLNKSQPKE